MTKIIKITKITKTELSGTKDIGSEDLELTDALRYHIDPTPGKISIVSTKPSSTSKDLSLAYTPGVAEPCLEIRKNPEDAYEYTSKGNLVGIITNGTAVLGLGNIGALAGKPVMEGKSVLFKRFAGIDAFDIEINEVDPKKIVEIVASLEPTFGGINLEDIKAPECFYIEEELIKRLKIPVFHDDQHGTAVIVAAALKNALLIAKKDISKIKVVFMGAGSAGIACANLLLDLGVKQKHIFMLDSVGLITKDRELNKYKQKFAQESVEHGILEEVIKDADVFIGVSVANILSEKMIQSMANVPIVFALANPKPEIKYELAKTAVPSSIIATGRSDYPNQVNNVLGFPFIFRGALDVRASRINKEMKLAAVNALALLAREKVPIEVIKAYNQSFSFGADYIIPKPFDPRLLSTVSLAVAKAAMDSGVARKPILDLASYKEKLEQLAKKLVLQSN
ncbi:malate dehydrogenase [Candidatus Woesearchaeota archaeon CG_4_10_14_0_2_um_filter_33_13]|nr:MAG: malate dehydrogenase [Candidatus Woesearchaeota archaeon CG_4_10_14_0_2_um_filter_33_13]